MQDKVNKRNLAYDVLRILAIMLVLYNHRESYLYFKYFESIGVKYVLTVLASVICKCGPAIFFMISGALLLEKQETFRKVFTRRILRMLIVMAAMAVLLKAQGNGSPSITLFSAGLCWYLYAYVAFLVMLPFLRILVQNMNVCNAILYFSITIAAYSFSGLVWPFPFSEAFTGNMLLFNATWASGCWQLVFPILGYWIIKIQSIEGEKKTEKGLFYTFLIGTFISLAISLVLTLYDMNTNGGNNIDQIWQHANLLPACLIFYVITKVFGSKHVNNRFADGLLRELSAATFGIFLIETHTDFSEKIFEFGLLAEPYIGRYMCSIVSILCELVLYFIVIFLVRRIPIVRKVL